MRLVRVTRAATVLLAAFAALTEPGCSPGAGRGVTRIMEERASWIRAGDAWVRAVPIDEPAEIALPRGRVFRAVALSADGPAVIRIARVGGDSREVSVAERITPLEIDGAAGERVALSARGDVHLLLPRFTPPSRRGRRTYLVVNDALRYDTFDSGVMERTGELLGGGRVYDTAFSASSWTLPSIASLMTGQRPAALRTPDGALIALPAAIPTLAERLRSHGMACLGYSANYTINHENGFTRGFDSFLVPSVLGHGEKPDVDWLLRNLRRDLSVFADCDLFLYVHTMETHEPYRNHETGESVTVVATGQEMERSRVEEAREAYRSEARHLDRRLADLIRGAGPEDTVVVTADHGEEFLEHGGFRHGPTLYDEVAHVPLIVMGPGVKNEHVARPVSLPSLFHWLTAGDASAPFRGRGAALETFAHGPPRWSMASGEGRIILFARSPGDLPEDVTARWLLLHHPAVQLLPLPGSDRAVDPDGILQKAPGLLARHFSGTRRAVWLFVRGDRVAGSVEGVEDDVLLWGSVEMSRVDPINGGARYLLDPGDLFVLARFPVQGSLPERIEIEGTGEGIPVATVLPRRFPGRGVSAWVDPGQPPRSITGRLETIRRLRALGYIR